MIGSFSALDLSSLRSSSPVEPPPQPDSGLQLAMADATQQAGAAALASIKAAFTSQATYVVPPKTTTNPLLASTLQALKKVTTNPAGVDVPVLASAGGPALAGAAAVPKILGMKPSTLLWVGAGGLVLVAGIVWWKRSRS